MWLLATTLVVFMAMVHIALAADDLGPAVGSRMADIGTPLHEWGKPRTLDSLMDEKRVVFFFRSVAWCPFCQAQLIELNGGVEPMAKRGFRLAGLSYDAPDVLEAFATKRGSTTRCCPIPAPRSSTDTHCATRNTVPAARPTACRGRSSSSSAATARSRPSCSNRRSRRARPSPS